MICTYCIRKYYRSRRVVSKILRPTLDKEMGITKSLCRPEALGKLISQSWRQKETSDVFTTKLRPTNSLLTALPVSTVHPPPPPPPPTSDLETCSLLETLGANHWRPVKICPLEDLTPRTVLTASGGHWNTYGLQAGGTHPTGMLSCLCTDIGVCTFSLWFGCRNSSLRKGRAEIDRMMAPRLR